MTRVLDRLGSGECLTICILCSGGADRQARTLTTSAFAGQAGGESSPLQFRSPFSVASNTPVSSPFSTASAGATLTQDDSLDDRLGLEAAGGRGKTWSQVSRKVAMCNASARAVKSASDAKREDSLYEPSALLL